jgi:hypothetical protein
MLERASISKNAVPPPPGTPVPHPQPPKSPTPSPAGAKPVSMERSAASKPETEELKPAEPPVLEDWWLIRDSDGRTGWVLGSRVDVDVPDDVAQYAEGQRIVGAYVLAKVHDDESNAPNHEVSEYVTALAPPKAGLPFDFDQIRVFTWSVKKHRYETGFRDKNIEGYVPVTVKMAPDPYGKSATATTPLPTFTYRVLADDAGPVIPDPVTGAIVPGKTILKTYRLEGNYVHRILAPGTPTGGEAHPEPVAEKKKKEAQKVAKKKR